MPKSLQGLLIIIILLLFLFIPQIASAKGLRTEELGNTDKAEIAQLAKKVKDNPEDGPLAFASSLGLIKHHHTEAFEQLRSLYEKSSDTVKAMIIKAIGQQRGNVIDAAGEYWRILSVALGSASDVISKEVITSLAFLESEEFFNKLLEVLKAKDSPKTAIDNVVKILCKFEQGPSGAPIVSGKTIGLRIEAVKSLPATQERNRKCLLDALGEELGEDFSNLNELGKWWEQNKTKPILQIQIEAKRRIQAKRKAAEDRAKTERQAKIQETIKRLNALKESRKKQEFLKLLAGPKTEPEILVFVMAWIKHQKKEEVKDALGKLQQLLNHMDTRVRVAAIEAIGAIGNQELIHDLSKRLSVSSSQERLTAVNAIAALKGKEACKVLLKALGTENDLIVRKALLQGLGVVGLPSAIQCLVEFAAVVSESGKKVDKLKDSLTPDFQIVIANALGSILKSKHRCEEVDRTLAVSCLLLMLSVDNNTVKFAAIKNLGEVGAVQAIDVLAKVLSNKEAIPGVRKAAARALGKMPNPDTMIVETLYANLKDDADEVARACMWALRNIAGLNGSQRQMDLELLHEFGKKLSAEKAYKLVLSLLQGLPDEKGLKTTEKKAIDRLYELKGILAQAHVEAGNYKVAAVELEKVAVYFPKILKYREMLARCYSAQQGQLTKAIDEYERLIKMVKPAEAQPYWKESLRLIKLVDDIKEKTKRVENALKLNPPQAVKEELERLKKELAATVPKESKTP
jgi:HEAT repeat protein